MTTLTLKLACEHPGELAISKVEPNIPDLGLVVRLDMLIYALRRLKLDLPENEGETGTVTIISEVRNAPAPSAEAKEFPYSDHTRQRMTDGHLRGDF